MSGGSFNYMFLKPAFQILEKYECDEEDDDRNLRHMIEKIREYGYEDVADEIQKIVDEAFVIEKKMDKYRDLFKAVEWRSSGDSGYVEEAIKELRK